MKKAKFLRRLLSIAISFTLIASAIGTGVFSAAAEETAESESAVAGFPPCHEQNEQVRLSV